VHVHGHRPSRRLRIGLQIARGRHVAVAQPRAIRGDLLCTRVIALLMPDAQQLLEKITHALTLVRGPIKGDRC
jgi:hypothetical protein